MATSRRQQIRLSPDEQAAFFRERKKAALATIDEVYSPRIVARVNDYDVRIAHTRGDHVWHVHEDTDEFFLVLDGELSIALRDGKVRDGDEPDGTGRDAAGHDGSEGRTVVLTKGSVFVVPRGVEHKPSSAGGASILLFEPSGTSSVGDSHDPVPGHVDATTGHALD